MKRTTVYLAITASAVTLAFAIPTAAQNRHAGNSDRAEQSGGHHKHFRQGRDQRRIRELFETYDTNEDGSVTQEEIDAERQARLSEFDSDQNGQLTLEEYQALWLDAMRERMVDRFQAHDDDGDGLVTAEEFNEEFSGLVERYDRNDDGALSVEDRNPRRARGEAPQETE